MNSLCVSSFAQDTVSVVFTKQYGFRFSDTPHEIIVGKTCVADVSFLSNISFFTALMLWTGGKSFKFTTLFYACRSISTLMSPVRCRTRSASESRQKRAAWSMPS